MQGTGKNHRNREEIVRLSKTVSTLTAKFRRLSLAVAIGMCSGRRANTAVQGVPGLRPGGAPTQLLAGVTELVDSRISEAEDGLHIPQEAPSSILKRHCMIAVSKQSVLFVRHKPKGLSNHAEVMIMLTALVSELNTCSSLMGE